MDIAKYLSRTELQQEIRANLEWRQRKNPNDDSLGFAQLTFAQIGTINKFFNVILLISIFMNNFFRIYSNRAFRTLF
jgi:hypothetical protein